MSRFWSPQPLYTTIVEFLEKKKGGSTDVELFKNLKMSRNDLNFKDLNKALMKLEVEGIIRVLNLTKDEKRLELITKT